MLIGLAAKNAILIVEFAKMLREQGKDPVTAALEAAKLRFRPILMTAFAFILGVVPLLTASGAGAEARKVMGMAVFCGMLIATILGVLLIPVLFVFDRDAGRPLRRRPQGRGDAGRARRVHPRGRRALTMRRTTLTAPDRRPPRRAAPGRAAPGRLHWSGPAYHRPEFPAPAQHRPLTTEPEAASLADLPWWEVFQDPALQELVREALRNNTDLAVAAARVVEARALAGRREARTSTPRCNAGGGVTGERRSLTTDPPLGTGADRDVTNYNVGVGLSWEIDLFGRLRSLNQAAIARMLATEQGQRRGGGPAFREAGETRAAP